VGPVLASPSDDERSSRETVAMTLIVIANTTETALGAATVASASTRRPETCFRSSRT
jgi:hypothetical protein